jgi:hypothetical protein
MIAPFVLEGAMNGPMFLEYGIGIARIDQNADHAEAGNKPCSNCNCFATNVLARKLTPVTLPPGRFMLTTRLNFTGSAPCSAAAILPLMVCWAAQRSGPPGGPLSITVAPVASLVTEAASTSGSVLFRAVVSAGRLKRRW